ncbi:MAG: protein phosphatase 2C domain-containing protein [Ktedonobacteraceae bacterium]|nr:protein phosphatase 2C domain-containing protein [Ktedonobacteraceae bacterium]
MLCPSCYTQNRDNARFCKRCGRVLSSALSSQQAEASQEQAPPVAVAVPPQTDTPDLPPTTPGTTGQSATGNPSQAAPQQNPPPAQPVSQDETQLAGQPSPADSPKEAGEETVYEHEEDDISLMPTQILTPEEMMKYHARRWQQELEHEQAQLSSTQPQDLAEQRKQSIIDTPTILFDSPASPLQASAQSDIASQPTMIISPQTAEQRTQEQQDATIPAPQIEQEKTGEAIETSITQDNQEIQEKEKTLPTSAVTASDQAAKGTQSKEEEKTITADAAPPPSAQEEERMNQEQNIPSVPSSTPPAEQAQQAQPAQPGQATEQTGATEATEAPGQQEPAQTTFPTLPAGTLVVARYEIGQVLSESEQEHVYQVTDKQGYKHCWNCGSEQNAEGDEFCIDCGAELNNAVYILHEYATESKENEAHVLQGSIVNTFIDQGHTYVVEQPQETQSAFPTGVRLLVASDSDAGDVRRSEPNEDSTLQLLIQRVHESLSSPAGVFLVADGMGGHANGQVASRMTVNIIAERITRELLLSPLSAEKAGEQPQQQDEESYVSLVRGAVEDANAALCEANQREKSDMGSTLTGFLLVGDFAYVFNVGDSRTYMLREGTLYQLTNDHSLVGQLVAGGLIEPDDVYTHPQRNQIYRSIGDKLNVQVDIVKQQVRPGDILLSCSDGLWEMVRNPQIADILKNAPDPQSACSQLIEAANTNGGEDNISAVVVLVR